MVLNQINTRQPLTRQGPPLKDCGSGLARGFVLFSCVFLLASSATAQVELGSQVLSESGGQAAASTTELVFSEGQTAIGSGVAGTADIGIGFIYTLSGSNLPLATNPPFSMVAISSLTVNWLANGNPAGTVYDLQISTMADFSSIIASSQTQNLSTTFTGLLPQTQYYVRAAVQSNLVFVQIGSTMTLGAVPPGSPIGISTFTAGSDSGFTVNWSSGAIATGYNSPGTLYLAQISTLSTFASLWTSSQTYNLSSAFSNLDTYTRYYARVQALNTDGSGTAFKIFGSTFTDPNFVYPAIINTVAGKGGYGYSGDGGPATSALIDVPSGLLIDATGNFYLAEMTHCVIRKVDINGIITTFAGNGSCGYSGDGGQATSAGLSQPRGMAVDAFGNIYIADASSHRVRRVSTNGIITTFAGDGTVGYGGDGGLATNAKMRSPFDVSADSLGNIYISDYSDNRIRRVSTNSIITTVAGNGSLGYSGDGGPSTAALLFNPYGLTTDADGNVYIADIGNYRVRKIDSNGIIDTIAGNGTYGSSGDGGPATSATMFPSNVVVDLAGNLYIADPAGSRVRKVDASGTIANYAGNGSTASSGDGGPAPNAALWVDVVAKGPMGSVFAADSNQRVREISVATAAPTTPSLIDTAATLTSMQWSWSKVPRTAAYKILTSTGGILMAGAISNRNTYFIETSLSTNTLYSRELVAINSAGISTSSVVSAYTLAAEPSGIAFGNTSTSTIYLTWNANTNPSTTNFEVSYTTANNFADSSAISTAATVTSTYTMVTSLFAQATYYFRVRAYNDDGIATAFTSIVATATAVLQSSVTAMSPSTGTIGVAFTITGAGFGTANGDSTQIRFGLGGSTASITSWSDTQIVGTVPLLSSGAYSLRIERQGSVFTATDAGTFTVVTPLISTATPVFGDVGFELSGSGFGEFVDSATTKVTLDGVTVDLSSWTDAMIRAVVPTSISVGSHTALVVLTYSVGSTQSNALAFEVTSGMKGLGMNGRLAQRTVMPPVFYQANLHLRASNGGKVTALSHASVLVPPGALSSDTSVSLERGAASGSDKDARDQARAAAALGDMGEAIEFGPARTQFLIPVTIELPYDLASVPLGRETALAIHYWDRVSGAWTPLLTEVDMVNHRLRAKTDHFSLYQPLLSGIYPAAATAEFRLVDVYAFPNPSRRGHIVTIRSQVGLADDVSVRIYDISGRLVNSGSLSSAQILDDGNGKGPQYTYDYVWDTGDVGSGVYLFAVTAKKTGSSPIRKTGKVGVIK